MDENLFPGGRGGATFIAIGDSFTEGLNDPAPGGGFRGWADRLASMLAAESPGLRYANLAVRGKLLRQIVREQVPAAVSLSPSLVSLAGGGNDILRPVGDPDTLAELFDVAVARLTQGGCRVLMFTGFDPVGFPVLRLLRGRIAAYNMHLRAIADARGCYLVDLWSMRFLRDARAWSPDRLHLTPESHQRIALRACEVLGVPVAEDWRATPDDTVAGIAPDPTPNAAANAAVGPGQGSRARQASALVPAAAPPPAPRAATPSAATLSAATPSAATPSAATPSAATPSAATPSAATPSAAPPTAPLSPPFSSAPASSSRPASSRLPSSRLPSSRLAPSRFASSRFGSSRLASSRLASPRPALSRLASSRLVAGRPAPAWLAARRDDIRWAREYALPWVNRRLRGTSSGDGLPPKRPDLKPVTPPITM